MKRIGYAVTLLLSTVIGAVLLYQGWLFSQVWWWTTHNPDTTSFMRLRLAELREHDPNAQLIHQWVPYAEISEHLKRAVVAAEDDRFMQHSGFDWEGIQRAIERNQQAGLPRAGGSTITQQLAKNLFLTPERSYLRKGQEAVLTVMIEATWPKQRILEVYLNVVEWGDGLFGCAAAAHHYFGTTPDRLGPAEASRLAVKLPNPRLYQREFGPRLTAHAERVRARMGRSQIP